MLEKKFDPRVVFYTTLLYIITLGFVNKYYQIVIILPFIFYQMKIFSTNIDKMKIILKSSIGI